jgi:hypothetical protein
MDILGIVEIWQQLSLDAPTVAFVWCFCFAYEAGAKLPLFMPFLLALGVWAVYVADRLMDGMGGANNGVLRTRHFFYARHRAAFASVLGIAVSVCALTVFFRMRRDVFWAYCLLGTAVCVYFVLVHAKGGVAQMWLPKELAVGCLFATGTALPSWVRSGDRTFGFSAAIVLFGLVCWMDCVAIESWETEASAADAEAGELRTTHDSTVWLGRHFYVMGLAIVILAILCRVWIGAAVRHVATACTVSCILLLTLHSMRNRLGIRWLRAVVDLSLLTPLMFVPKMIHVFLPR